MSNINQISIAKTLKSEIVGQLTDSHGQIGSQGLAQGYLNLRRKAIGPREVLRVDADDSVIDKDIIVKAFFDVRDDQRSPDLYVADPVRNRRFLMRCRELGESASDYLINKALFNARKANLLKDLHSVRMTFNHEEYVFASEFAATELRYRTGASIDDIICDPKLASEFDAIAMKISPGFDSIQYRWALLSVRKAGRSQSAKWKPEYVMPELAEPIPLLSTTGARLPDDPGVYLLMERSRTLYIHGTKNLSRGVGRHQHTDFRAIFPDYLWNPNPGDLLVSFAVVSQSKLMRPVETRLICERKPLFNIANAA